MARRRRDSRWDRPWGPTPPRGPALSPHRERMRFGTTWWGRSWIDALEQRARLDSNRLPRGRTYARTGAVGPLRVGPGEVRAAVQGSRAQPYAVHLRVREFTSAEWDRAIAAIAARAAHAASLLDGELAPGIVEDLERARIALLPSAGELGTSCTCPDWANPCKHAAAVCYLVTDVMDADPFTILVLRGRTREQVLAGLRRARSAEDEPRARRRAVVAGATDAGVEARTLFRDARDVGMRGALPTLPLPPDHPGTPAALAVDPPPGSDVNRGDLAGLAADAARRAWELWRGVGDSGLQLPDQADLARLAAQRVGRTGFDDFARHVGVPPRALMRLALAWRAGGNAALEVLEGPAWYPAAEDVDEGARALGAIGGGVTVRGDRVTGAGGGVQLRYGRDGRWYLCVRRAGTWEIHDPPSADPHALVPLVTRLRGAAQQTQT